MNKLAIIFISILFLFSIFTYSFVDVNLVYFKPLYSGLYLTWRGVLAVIFAAFISVLFLCYFFIYKNVSLYEKKLKKIIILIALTTLFSYPAALSFDIFNYITTAKVAFYYHENPYVVYPNEFVNEPYLAFTRATNKLALYAPLWIILSGVPFSLGFGNFILTLLSFKVFILLFYLATVYLISRMDRVAAIVFALNPLVIIETLVSSHNDIVMVFFALLGLSLIKSNKGLALSSLVASILIKFATIFVIPIFVISQFNKITQSKVYFLAALSMFVIFLLSPIREELYSWYAIWFIVFTCFLHKNKYLQNIVIFLSFGLMLRYIPYIATGDYFGSTPIIRIVLTIIPVGGYLIYAFIKKETKFNF